MNVPRLRLSIVGVVIVGLFAALFARLYDLQIIGSPEYQVQAEANRVRLVQVPAPRGRILDRHGTVLVDNRIAVVVAVDRTEFGRLSDDHQARVLFLLTHELNQVGHEIGVEEIRARIFDERFSRYAPVPIAEDVPEDLKIYLEEHPEDFPSVEVERTAVRSYPYGPLASNVIGYVGKINGAELDEVRGEADKPYALNDDIGKAGVEKSYEEHLRGTPGLQQIEVDAEGDPVRVISDRLPQPGSDVVLTLDADLQALAQQRLEQGLAEARAREPSGDSPPHRGTRGAVVVQDPNSGQILAMGSHPTYDPRAFVNGINAEQWAFLNDPANGYPLNNWALQGQWAPGSTFKLFTSYAALMSGLMAPDTVFFDQGGYQIPGCTDDPNCWRSNAGGNSFGSITIDDAITVSSNSFFYNVGAQFWLQQERLGGEDAMQQYIAPWGIGAQSGIPLSFEAEGRLPSPQWRRDFCEQVNCSDPQWRTGDNVNIAIGQGDVTVTPLQLANGYATLANGGIRYQPQVVARIEPPDADPRVVEPEPAHLVELPPHVRQPIHDGMVGVTQNGTASRAFAGFPHEDWPVAGKTGTGAVDDEADTAVFAAYGPAPAPQYAVSVVMEESGYGGAAAAPVARALFDVLAGVEPMPSVPPGGVLAPTDEPLASVQGAYD
jgi:penicillin-binding protein 2